jgi:oxygen-dependent protoporphyrinogen oxidase
MSSDRPTVAVVGAGVTGLAAAWQLVQARAAAPEPDVVVLEATTRLGGKIRTSPDTPGLEYGPDAFLARVPQAVELCRELGLADELVSPATGRAFLWWRGALRPLPAGLVLGVPSDLPAVAHSRIVGPVGLARAALDLVLPASSAPDDHDRSVGEIVTARFGRQVQQRLVDPLVGGIHAGRSELLSARATAPQLDSAARASRSLLLGLRRTAGAAGPSSSATPAVSGTWSRHWRNGSSAPAWTYAPDGRWTRSSATAGRGRCPARRERCVPTPSSCARPPRWPPGY